jgi:hypothetical protein
MSKIALFLAEIQLCGPSDGIAVVPNEIVRAVAIKHSISIDEAKRELHQAAEAFYAQGWAAGLSPVEYRVEYRTRVGACNLWGTVVYMLSRPAGGGGADSAECAVCRDDRTERFACPDGLLRCRRCGGGS